MSKQGGVFIEASQDISQLQKPKKMTLKDSQYLDKGISNYVDTKKVFQNQVDLYMCDKMTALTPFTKKKKQTFNPIKYKIISVSYPINLGQYQKSRKKYKCQVKYVSRELQGPPRKKDIKCKTIFFGLKGVADFIDDFNEAKRIQRINIMQNTQDVFHPNHFRLVFLNRCKTLEESYTKYIIELGL